jgi:hypothetical protein
MRIHFEDHVGFQRAVLHVAVACSALAAVATLAGAARLRPGVVVLGAAMATLALALGHLRLVRDAVGDAVARASAGADAHERHLLARAAAAHARIARSVGRHGDSGGGRALATTAATATIAVAELARRRRALSGALEIARPADVEDEVAALEAKRGDATDDLARAGYARAATAARERGARVASVVGILDRIDARLLVAVSELEAAALASAALAEITPDDPRAALGATCERLRSASADLGAECDAYTELAAL